MLQSDLLSYDLHAVSHIESKVFLSLDCPSGSGPLFVTASASRSTTIRSHNYPWDYYNNLECEWHIQKDHNLNSSYVLRVVFNDFQLEAEPASSSSFCPYDNLTFYDGDSNLSPLLGSYCGAVHPEAIYSTGYNLYCEYGIYRRVLFNWAIKPFKLAACMEAGHFGNLLILQNIHKTTVGMYRQL